MSPTHRRDFLKFLGSSLALSVPVLSGCSSLGKTSKIQFSRDELLKSGIFFDPLKPQVSDQVELVRGLRSDVLISWGDSIGKSPHQFGQNADYVNTVSLNEKEAIMWVNHESVEVNLLHGFKPLKRTREEIDLEMKQVGGSLIHIEKRGQKWRVKDQSPYHRRIDAKTSIPFSPGYKIRGKSKAMGTLANCAGGKTPWGTFLTCEENFQDYYKDPDSKEKPHKHFEWDRYYKNPIEHYGWVVEIEPRSGKSKKLVPLGRFSHESATCILASDQRCVVYSGDDKVDQFLYKFISDRPGSLDQGTLYVAQIEKGQWLSLDFKSQKILQENFKDQTEVLVQCRKAAALLGASPLDRPEDIEVDPRTGSVLVSLTGNSQKKRRFGSILRIEETQGDYRSLNFKAEVFVPSGPESGLACPDNLCIDPKGNLWVTNDLFKGKATREQLAPYGNNGLFYIPLSGELAGQVFQVASAPMGAEFTGPHFAPDGKSLFLSVQHPGEGAKSRDQLKSHWPKGGQELPRSSVIEVQGPLFDKMFG